MSNLTYTDVPIDLIVNKLSKEKYDSLVNANLINDTEIYLVDEDNLDAASGVISNVGTPISPTDAANKSYVDTVSSNIVNAFPEIPANIVTNNAGNNTSNLAIGKNTISRGYNSILIGNSVSGSGIAIGYDTSAYSFSIAIGCHAKATRDNSIAAGYSAEATAYSSIATGRSARATGDSSIATGYGAQATGSSSIATGYGAKATGSSSIATGHDAQATGSNTIAIGTYCHAAPGDVLATANTPIVIGSNYADVSAAQIRVTKEGIMTVGGKEVGASLFETKTFTTDSQTSESDLMVIAKQENGVQPRLHAGDKDIHGVTGFSNESDKYTGQRYILDWDLAMSNDTSYLMGATKWTGSRRIGANNDAFTTTFVQPLIPANTGTTNQVLPYALPCFENSPVYWNGHIIWNNSLCASTGKYTAQAKDITIPWYKVSTDVSGVEFVINNAGNNTSNLAIGTFAQATCDRSIAIGCNAQAIGSHSIAIGCRAQAGLFSIATGYANATGSRSIATGFGAQATGSHSIAIGHTTQATGNYSIATGYAVQATGCHSIATGTGAYAQDDYTIAIGTSKDFFNDIISFSVSASTAVPIVIGSDHSSVSAAQITVTSAGILNVGGVEMAKKSDALITIKRWDD